MIRTFFAEIEQKKYFFMFFTAVVYIAGLCGFYCDKALEIALVLTILGIIALVKNYLSVKIVIFWYLIFFIAFFNASFRVKTIDDLQKFAPRETVIKGQVISIPEKFQNKQKFFFKAYEIQDKGDFEKINSKTLVTLYKNGTEKNINIGDYCYIKGKLRTPAAVTNPSQFDYERYLKNFNTYSMLYAQENDCIKDIKPGHFKWNFLQGLNNIKNNIIPTHEKYMKSPNLEILGGVIFGDDAVSTPEAIKDTFKSSGLLHILAASGMNVALIYGILFFILKTFRVPFKISVLSGIFVVILYTLMTGLGPSVIRAAIILIFVLIGKLMDREAHSISLLSFVAILMLLYNPSYINDVGFQLSFIVTFGLLIMTEPIVSKIKFLPKFLSGAIFVPLIAQIWVAPIQMYYFNSFSTYSVFANILSVPFLTVISFGGFLSSVLAMIKPIASGVCFAFDFILNPMITCIVNISNYFAQLPHALVQVQQPTILQIFFYYEAVLLLVFMLKKGVSKKYFITFISIILVVLGLGYHNQDKFELLTFDMKNADAFLVNAHGKYFIIDTGKTGYNCSKSPAKYIIVEYLKDKGIKRIEGLILTHFDSDHAGGAEDILENVYVKTIYVNSLNDKSVIAQNIYKKYPKKIKLVQNNEHIFSGEKTEITVYKANFKGEEADNDNSIITLIAENDYKILMMGDAGVATFNKLKKYIPKDVYILKVGHHGGKNVVNHQMLEHLKPTYAIISTGLNVYGHPNPITINNLVMHNVKILRTDRDNAIKFEGKNVYTFDNRQGFKLQYK